MMHRLQLLCLIILLAKHARGDGRACDAQSVGQIPSLKGFWVPHEDPDYRGLYDAVSCPAWGQDWDCKMNGQTSPEQVASVYNKVFTPFECDLRPWDAQKFAQCTAKKRIIMVGDSLMRQQFQSLACLTSNVTVRGEHHNWDQEGIPVAREHNYTARGIEGDFVIPRQYLGGFDLESGTKVYLRAFGRFNLSLWDDVMAEFQPLTDQDVIVVNFGAWYPRYNIYEAGDPWKAWQLDMTELINLRLARYAAQSFWRSSTATHFGGVNGTMTFDKDACKALADSGVCPPSPLNESWYEDWMKMFLRSCGPRCAKVRMLPVFDLTQARYDAHHGNFGRGKETWVLDCRHFCSPVVDVWNQVFFNLLC